MRTLPSLRIPLGILLALAAPGAALAQDPILSEFQASNSSTLDDEDGESSDWIEVHNPSPAAIDLGGWFLTDDDDELTRWQVPAPTSLPAGGFLVVFASGKDRSDAASELHTNFKLSASGEYLALVRPDGVTIAGEFAPGYPAQYPDTSYGVPFDPTPRGGASYFLSPTPGAANGPGGPLVLDIEHQPQLPGASDDTTVTGYVPTDLGAGGSVTLEWRVGYDTLQSTPMVDDGSGSDTAADDDVYTALIPAAAYTAGRMLRYRIRAADSAGNATTLPLFSDPEKSAEFFGTIVHDPSVQSTLPVWWWWTEQPTQSHTWQGARASVFYGGEFYDNVFVRLRGGSSATYPKKSLKFDFNPGHRLRFADGGPRHDEININTTWADKAFVRQPLSYQLYLDAGCVASESFPVRTQRNGEFESVAIFIEEPGEEAFLERHGLDPNGALYKMYNRFTSWKGGAEKKTRLHEGKSDLKQFIKGLNASGTDLRDFMFDNADIAACINYVAVTTLIHDNDHIAKNYFVYRDSEGDKEWRLLPWDKDLTWGRNYLTNKGVLNDVLWAAIDPYSHPLFGDQNHPKNDGPWNKFIDRLHQVPEIQEMYVRRLRTLMDEYLQPLDTPLAERHLEARLAQFVAEMAPDVALDEAKWGIPTWGAPYDFRTDVGRLAEIYVRTRRFHLYETHGFPNGIIPPPHPSPPITIFHIEGDPASGKATEAYVELANPAGLAADLSGWRLEGAIEFTFEGGTVIGRQRSLFVSPKVKAFRKRAQSPTGGEGNFVVGPYAGVISAGDWVRLVDRDGNVVDERQY